MFATCTRSLIPRFPASFIPQAVSSTLGSMSLRLRILVGTCFTILLAGLGVTDAVLTSGMMVYPAGTFAVDRDQNGVPRKKEPDVAVVLNGESVTTQNSDSKSLLERIVPKEVPIATRVLLKNNDRIGLLSYIESPDVRPYFMALKEALRASFSPALKDLSDITEAPPGHSVRNVLSFTDPSISEEKLIFIRVRERLYEFHVAQGKDAFIQALIEKLTE